MPSDASKLVHKYVDEVINGKSSRPIGELERLAVERYLRDRDQAKSKGFKLDEVEAARRIDFAKMCRHTAGEYARRRFDLQGFQAFKLWNIFGWYVEPGVRRFTESYDGMARKGAKTEVAGVIANSIYLMDDIEGAEVYFAATKSKQAMVTFRVARKMMSFFKKDYPSFTRNIAVQKYKVINNETDSFFEAVTADDEKQDGYRPLCAVIDEYHAHPSSDLKEVLRTGMGMYRSPLIHHTTTAGFNLEGPCYKLRKVGIDILKGIKEDESFFYIEHALDEDDDWNDKTVWGKASPLIGTTPTWRYIDNEYTKAINEGKSKEIQFRVKYLNQWVSTSTTFISDELWMRNGTDWSPEDFRGRRIFLGFDLGSVSDLTSMCVLIAPEHDDEPIRVFWKYYVPHDTADKRGVSDKVSYLKWAADGHITLTPGGVTEYAYIKKDVAELIQKYDFQIAFGDPWNGTAFYSELNETFGESFYTLYQSSKKLNEPTKLIEELCIKGRLDHGKNPVARWNMSNVLIKRDSDGCIKIDKEKVVEKVDGISALVDALEAWRQETINPRKKVYKASDLI